MAESQIELILSEYFSHKEDIDNVILFGSFGKNTFNEKSDVDIAIHSKSELDFLQMVEIQNDLSILCKREIDLADLSKAEGVFLYQIMTTGKRIKTDSNVFVKYLMKALCLKEDFLPIIERSRKEKLRRFVNG